MVARRKLICDFIFKLCYLFLNVLRYAQVSKFEAEFIDKVQGFNSHYTRMYKITESTILTIEATSIVYLPGQRSEKEKSCT